MKKILKIVAGLVVVLAIIIAAAISIAFYATSGMTNTADEFFKAVKQQDMTKARGYLAEEFKAGTDETALKTFLSKSAIINFKKTSWSERSVSGGRGELNGSITTETGGNIPIRVVFVKEQGVWKIYALQKSTAGIQTSETTTPNVPDKGEQISLTKQSMHDFAVSINNKSMEYFCNSVSKTWQLQFTTEKLNEAFAPFFTAGIDFTVLDPLMPSFDGDASIDENGLLVIKGHYPTKPSQVTFEHKYIYEGVAWKLVGFHINVKPREVVGWNTSGIQH